MYVYLDRYLALLPSCTPHGAGPCWTASHLTSPARIRSLPQSPLALLLLLFNLFKTVQDKSRRRGAEIKVVKNEHSRLSNGQPLNSTTACLPASRHSSSSGRPAASNPLLASHTPSPNADPDGMARRGTAQDRRLSAASPSSGSPAASQFSRAHSLTFTRRPFSTNPDRRRQLPETYCTWQVVAVRAAEVGMGSLLGKLRSST